MIRPLRKSTSRILVSVCLVVAAALAIYASTMIESMRDDPSIQARVEAFERMNVDARTGTLGTDSTNSEATGTDSVRGAYDGHDSTGTR